MDGTLYHCWLWYLLCHNLPMLIVNAIFFLVQLLSPLPNSWLGFKNQNSEEWQWSKMTQNQATRFWCDRHVDTESRPQEGKCCESVQAVVSPCIVYTSYFFTIHMLVCLFRLPVIIWCVPHLVEFITINFSLNTFRLSKNWGPLEVLTSWRAQIKQTTLAVHQNSLYRC
jgi:hypothetical protein